MPYSSQIDEIKEYRDPRQLIWLKNWRYSHPHYSRDYNRNLWATSSKYREQIRNHMKSYKSKVIWYYSNGTYQCACCGIYGLPFLSVNHINHDGHIERAKWFKSGTKQMTGNQYGKIIAMGYPKGINVLCIGCNTYETMYGRLEGKHCPHKTGNKSGKKCACCGEEYIINTKNELCSNCKWFESRFKTPCPHKAGF